MPGAVGRGGTSRPVASQRTRQEFPSLSTETTLPAPPPLCSLNSSDSSSVSRTRIPSVTRNSRPQRASRPPPPDMSLDLPERDTGEKIEALFSPCSSGCGVTSRFDQEGLVAGARRAPPFVMSESGMCRQVIALFFRKLDSFVVEFLNLPRLEAWRRARLNFFLKKTSWGEETSFLPRCWGCWGCVGELGPVFPV